MKARMIILGLILMAGVMSCKNTTTVQDITGSWEGNVFLLDQSHTESLQLELNENYEYRLKSNDTGKHIISSGEFMLQDGKITFHPSFISDTHQIGMITGLNNRPVKRLDINKTSGLQIKVNDVWHFLEKCN